jgi:tetratricopeptide (TPR) repeat protein
VGNAQDQAFAALVVRQGLLTPEHLRRAEATRSRSDQPLSQLLVEANLLGADQASDLLRRLIRFRYACRHCGHAEPYEGLAGLVDLVCSQCGGGLELPQREGGPSGEYALERARSGEHVVDTSRRPADGERRLGSYVLVRELGRGANGVVYEARREGLPRRFALKVLLSAKFSDPETVERFKQEAFLASRIDEPGIVSVYDVGRHGNHYFLAMDFVAGETLDRRIKRAGPVPPREAARLVRDMALIMQSAHDQGIVHRDLKPANVILEAGTARPRITDFGLARDLTREDSGGLTKTGDVLGTPYYMAPEQYVPNRTPDARVDVWALGVILYECLTGVRPFRSKTFLEMMRLVRHTEPASPGQLVSTLPVDLEAICLRAMAKSPGQRYPSAKRLADDLDLFLRGLQPTDSDSSIVPPRLAGRARRGKAMAVVGGVILGGSVGLIAALVKVRGAQPEVAPGVEREVDEAPTEGTAADQGDPEQSPFARALEESVLLAHQGAPALRAERALEVTRALADTDQERAQVDAALANLRMRRGRWDEACEAAALVPRDSGSAWREATWSRAMALEHTGRGREALAAYEALAEEDPRGAWGRCGAAAAARLDGRQSEVDGYVRQALSLDPRLVPALLEGSMSASNLGSTARGEDLLRQALTLAPDHVRVHVLLAMTVWEFRGEVEEANLHLREAIDLAAPVQLPGALVLRAAIAGNIGRLDDATRDLDEVLSLDPDHVDALFNRGMIRRLRHGEEQPGADWERLAVQDWFRAYHRSPAEFTRLIEVRLAPRGQAMISEVLDLPGREPVLVEVSPRLRMALEDRALLAPEAARRSLLEALLLAAEGHPWRRIVPHLEAARREAPESQAVALETARLAVGRQVFSVATRALERARELDAPPAELGFLEGLVGADRGKRYLSVEVWERVIRESPHTTYGQLARAYALFTYTSYPDALRALERVEAEEPDNLYALNLRAVLSAEPGDPEEGERLTQRAVELHGLLDARLIMLKVHCESMRVAGPDMTIDDAGDLAPAFSWMTRAFGVMEGAGPRLAAVRLALPQQDRAWHRRALHWLDEAQFLEPDRGEVYMWQGCAALITGRDKEEVLEQWRQARRVEERIQLPRDWLGIYQERFGDASEVEALLQLAPPEQEFPPDQPPADRDQ